jgi:hypothetical protein
LTQQETCIVGMLFSNHESTIAISNFSEVEENGKIFSEQIHKVYELGLAHTAYDIRHFLDDLGVNRIPLDRQDADDIEN